MNRLVVVLGTIHELQGHAKRSRNVDDPLYSELVNELITIWSRTHGVFAKRWHELSRAEN